MSEMRNGIRRWERHHVIFEIGERQYMAECAGINLDDELWDVFEMDSGFKEHMARFDTQDDAVECAFKAAHSYQQKQQDAEWIYLGSQDSPDTPMIFNRRQPDGTFRPLSDFFERDKGGEDS